MDAPAKVRQIVNELAVAWLRLATSGAVWRGWANASRKRRGPARRTSDSQSLMPRELALRLALRSLTCAMERRRDFWFIPLGVI